MPRGEGLIGLSHLVCETVAWSVAALSPRTSDYCTLRRRPGNSLHSACWAPRRARLGRCCSATGRSSRRPPGSSSSGSGSTSLACSGCPSCIESGDSTSWPFEVGATSALSSWAGLSAWAGRPVSARCSAASCSSPARARHYGRGWPSCLRTHSALACRSSWWLWPSTARRFCLDG
jgi:hypothetical protein